MTLYLKWKNDTVGIINSDHSVDFIKDNYNDTVALYTRGSSQWTNSEFENFLMERVVSRDRRDIEKILFRCGLSVYNVFNVAKITKAINAKDLFWISNSKDEKFEDAVTEVFNSIFNQKIDLVGDSINTPEGFNIKRYGVYENNYGIYKNRINPLTTDVESEVAVYLLAKEFEIDCCPAYKVDEDTMFSAFMYDFSKEFIVHFRRLFSKDFHRETNEYANLMAVRPQYKEKYIQMLFLDFVTRQDERHLSNFAIKISSDRQERFYPLYDNGRSLFYEDTEILVSKACKDVEGYSTTFGYEGTYYDYLGDIALKEEKFCNLVNLNIKRDTIEKILKKAGFSDYRLEGSTEWICKSIEMVKNLDKKRSFKLNSDIKRDR